MALKIEENVQGLFKLTSTITDDKLHDAEFIDEKEAKKILINKEFWQFLENVIEIGINFPSGYFINDKTRKGNPAAEFINYAYEHAESGNIIFSKFNEIRNLLKLDFDIVSIDYEEPNEKETIDDSTITDELI